MSGSVGGPPGDRRVYPRSPWKTADRIALRFGLLRCGGVAEAARACAGEPVGPYDPSPRQRLEEVLAWSVSEDHFALPDAHGIKVAG